MQIFCKECGKKYMENTVKYRIYFVHNRNLHITKICETCKISLQKLESLYVKKLPILKILCIKIIAKLIITKKRFRKNRS